MSTLQRTVKDQDAWLRATFGERIGRAIVLAMLVIGSIIFMLPFYIMVAMSLKTPTEVGTTNPWEWPRNPTFNNYIEVLTNPNVSFPLFFKNTVVIAVVATLGVLLTSSVVAYAFARIQFVGREKLFILLLSTMMLPAVVTMIPTYVMYAQVRWVNTGLPLTVPAFFGGGAFNIFLLRQFFMGIPRELDEAAILDGAGHWTIFSKVIMPLSGAALATVGVFAFIHNWKDYFGPLIYLNDVNSQTLELGLATYNSLRSQEWHLIMSGAVLVTIPLIIIFFLGQRYFVKGIVMSGIK